MANTITGDGFIIVSKAEEDDVEQDLFGRIEDRPKPQEVTWQELKTDWRTQKRIAENTYTRCRSTLLTIPYDFRSNYFSFFEELASQVELGTQPEHLFLSIVQRKGADLIRSFLEYQNSAGSTFVSELREEEDAQDDEPSIENLEDQILIPFRMIIAILTMIEATNGIEATIFEHQRRAEKLAQSDPEEALHANKSAARLCERWPTGHIFPRYRPGRIPLNPWVIKLVLFLDQVGMPHKQVARVLDKDPARVRQILSDLKKNSLDSKKGTTTVNR